MRPTRIVDMTPKSISEAIAPVLEGFPVERAWLFGSVARGEQRRGSDIDLIVELSAGAHMGLSFMDIETSLARELRHEVDVSTIDRRRCSSAFLKNYDREKVLVYERTAG